MIEDIQALGDTCPSKRTTTDEKKGREGGRKGEQGMNELELNLFGSSRAEREGEGEDEPEKAQKSFVIIGTKGREEHLVCVKEGRSAWEVSDGRGGGRSWEEGRWRRDRAQLTRPPEKQHILHGSIR